MRFFAEVRERLRAFLYRDRENRELEEELRFHIELQREQNIARGMSPSEARRQAHLRLGGLSRVREATRDARGVRWAQILVEDVRYSLRGIRANPLFSLSLVVTLGLGVGAIAAMFSVVDALLLRPLPYAEPDRLVEVRPLDPETGVARPYFTLEGAREWGIQDDVFEATFHHARASVLYTGGTEPKTLPVQIVSPSFEEVLRVWPSIGRGFDAADAYPGAAPVGVLSNGFWRTAHGGDPEVIGRVIELDGIGHEIIGVMPAGFKFPTYAHTDAWVPVHADGEALGQTISRLALIGRLSPGASPEIAQARADAHSAALAESMPRDQGWTVRLSEFSARRVGEQIRRPIWFLAGSVALILLVATLNGINLVLVRAWSRTRELAVRAALGASRLRLIAQLLTESALLAAASGMLAVGFAFGTLRLIQGIIPDSITFFAPYPLAVEQRTLGFAFTVAVAVGLTVGILPALLATRVGSSAVGSAVSPHSTRTKTRSRLRQVFVVAEVALSVTLLVGAGLLINSFVRLVRVDPGFRLDNVALIDLNMSLAEYPSGEDRMAFLRLVETRLEAIPGVLGVTTGGGGLPASTFTDGGSLVAEDESIRSTGLPQYIPSVSVSPDFFELLDVRILAGRPFAEEDLGTENAIVDSDLARFLWGDASALGKRFRVSEGWEWMTVVGVVGDIRLLGPDDRLGDFEILTAAGDRAANYSSLGIRTAGDPEALFPAIREALLELDPRQPVSNLRTARSEYAGTVDMPRFLLVLMSALSGLALLLAGIGIYGVLAFGVAQRRFELAVRIALGAGPAALSRRVLTEGLGLAAGGAILGVICALALSGLIRGLLFGVEPNDPGTVATVVGLSLLVAAVACWLPARRATRVDPVEVLKAN